APRRSLLRSHRWTRQPKRKRGRPAGRVVTTETTSSGPKFAPRSQTDHKPIGQRRQPAVIRADSTWQRGLELVVEETVPEIGGRWGARRIAAADTLADSIR